MKSRKQNISSQILIMAMAAVVVVLMIQMAQAQDANPLLAQAGTQASQTNYNNQSAMRTQTLQMNMPNKTLGQRLRENTTLTYYQQFLGPTLSGPSTETYNVFQEGIDTPRSGQAPLQSFHAMSLRHQINQNWAVGASLAVSTFYTDTVETRTGGINDNRADWFNSRFFVALPAFATSIGTLYSTVAYEAPTSNISKEDDMQGAAVISESFAFNMPNPKWAVGIIGQYYRAFYTASQNTVAPSVSNGMINGPRPLQTTIVSGGPYANFRFAEQWSLNSIITLDWDQRGVQADSREWNNNLPHRGRLSLNYYPPIKYLTNVGVFAQALLKYRPDTTAMGADFSVRF
jgi:hypothetical protein